MPTHEPFIETRHDGDIALLTLRRGKVNALVSDVLTDLRQAVDDAADAQALVVTGHGPFFSFGFDVPHIHAGTREQFAAFLHEFADLYHHMFTRPVPIVAAINGHAVAGGCMLALTADRRLMVRGKARISLNEIQFGASVPAGAVEMLRFAVGDRAATEILTTGRFFSAEEAVGLGLVDRAVDDLESAAIDEARSLSRHLPAFSSMKRMLRRDAAARMRTGEAASIEQFLDIWYSPETQAQVARIQIRA